MSQETNPSITKESIGYSSREKMISVATVDTGAHLVPGHLQPSRGVSRERCKVMSDPGES